jgi:hypothetical protein
VFLLTTTELAANKPHCAAIVSVDVKCLCLLATIFLIVAYTRFDERERQEVRKKQAKKYNEKKRLTFWHRNLAFKF